MALTARSRDVFRPTSGPIPAGSPVAMATRGKAFGMAVFFSWCLVSEVRHTLQQPLKRTHKRHQQIYDPAPLFDLKFLNTFCRDGSRNFKSAALELFHNTPQGGNCAMRYLKFLGVLAGFLFSVNLNVAAQEWPSRPVKIIAPFAPRRNSGYAGPHCSGATLGSAQRPVRG